MKFSALALIFTAVCRGRDEREPGSTPGTPGGEQYTPDASDWSTFYSKAVLENPKNTDHSPDGIFWLDQDDFVPWDGTVYNPEDYTRGELASLICTGNTIRGIYELFYSTNPFADIVNPTKAEVDYWHTVALNHVRAMVGYTEEEYIIRPDKCLHLRALWSTEKYTTRKWDTAKYPGTCEGSTNPHCGAGFIPDIEDQQPYLPDDISHCVKRAGSEGLFNSAKSNIPWSIKWIRPLCYTLGAEGFWGGHTGPWFHRSQFGWDWNDPDPDNGNSNAGLRAKWSGPSGANKYQNPDTATERWQIQREDVNPDPRFTGYECDNIIWNGGVHNATECYDQTMNDDNCGKRFMTMSSGFGCACYPVDMATCEVKNIGNRKTWDFEPVDPTWDGLFVDTTKDFSNSQLPFNGRRCPNIKWQVKAGDPAHCLQKIVENDYFGGECGRNFLTWNVANGGCACYPPTQETCTRAESVGESGRQTFELEVDPTYFTPEPTTSPRPTDPPVAPTDSPVAPTSAPVEPTTAPVEPTIAPVEPTSAPVEPTSAPVEPTSAPVEPTSAPVEPTTAPVEPTSAPVEPTTAPVEPTSAPVEPTSAPVEPTSAPVEPTSAPVEPTSAPVEPTSAPVEPTSAPVEPTTAPVEPTTAPVEPTSAPVEPTSAPVETPTPFCSDDALGYFLMKVRKIRTDDNTRIPYGVLQTCAWLEQLPEGEKADICESKVSYHQGKAYESGTAWRDTDLEGTFGPAQKLCKDTCNSCDSCYENSSSKWFWKVKSNGNAVKKDCDWLADRRDTLKDGHCASTVTFEGYQPASVECPVTCSYLTGDCDHIEITGAPTPAPPAGTEYIGCFKDKKNDRALDKFMGKKKSIDECATLCSDYNYFGLQKNYQCRCGNEGHDKHGPAEGCECYGQNIGNRNCVFMKQEDSTSSSNKFWE